MPALLSCNEKFVYNVNGLQNLRLRFNGWLGKQIFAHVT